MGRKRVHTALAPLSHRPNNIFWLRSSAGPSLAKGGRHRSTRSWRASAWGGPSKWVPWSRGDWACCEHRRAAKTTYWLNNVGREEVMAFRFSARSGC